MAKPTKVHGTETTFTDGNVKTWCGLTKPFAESAGGTMYHTVTCTKCRKIMVKQELISA